MTEIKTAQVKGRINEYGSVNLACGNTYGAPSFVAVEGLTESEIHEAAALLEKSREVCEQKKITHDGPYQFRAFGGGCNNDHYAWNDPNECPSCGRKVVVK